MTMSNTKVNVTFRELGEKLSYDATTIRSWARKPVAGRAYDPNEINYDFINAQLAKAGIDVEATLGGKLGVDIMIEKSLSHAGNGSAIIKLKACEMQVGVTYLIISHVNRFHYTLKGIAKVGDENVYIFQDERYGEFKKTQDAYRALSESELSSERWTIRELK